MKKVILICFLFGFLIPIGMVAQDLRILNVNIRRPTPSALSEWSRDPTIVQITIQNSSTTVVSDIRVIFEIKRDGRTIVTLKPEDPNVPRFIFPPGITVVNGPDVAPEILYRSGGIDVLDPALERQAIRTQQLPEGSYEYCVWLLSPDGSVIHRLESCPRFDIFLPDPPQLIAPKNQFDLPDPDRSPPVFQWTSIAPIPPGMTPQYRLRIYPVYHGQSARDAVDRNVPFFDRTLSVTNYPYQLSDPFFSSVSGAEKFAWQIQTLDQFGNPVAVRGDNEGKSEIALFGLAEELTPEGEGEEGATTGIRLIPQWPEQNDTIPWRHPLLIVRFEPYDDSLRGVILNLTLQGGGVTLTNTRTLRWPLGPARSQGVSRERAVYHFVNAINDAGEFLDWSDQLRRGVSYRWQVRATFQWANGRTETVSTPWREFVIGLKQPSRIAPPEMQSFPRNTRVRVRWRTPQPNALNYTPSEMISRIRSSTFLHTPYAQEKIRVQISRTEDFTDLVTTATSTHPAADLYRIGDDCLEFFTEKSLQTPELTEPGMYYWRVQYLNDDDTPYLTGPVWRFQIRDGGTGVSVSRCRLSLSPFLYRIEHFLLILFPLTRQRKYSGA